MNLFSGQPLSGPIKCEIVTRTEGSNDVSGKTCIGYIPCELTAPVKVCNDAGFTKSSVLEMVQYKPLDVVFWDANIRNIIEWIKVCITIYNIIFT